MAWLPLFDARSVVPEPSRLYWQVAIIAPFTPLVLAYFGYYEPPERKDPWPWRSLLQIAAPLCVS
jgi:hypothetical protein